MALEPQPRSKEATCIAHVHRALNSGILTSRRSLRPLTAPLATAGAGLYGSLCCGLWRAPGHPQTCLKLPKSARCVISKLEQPAASRRKQGPSPAAAPLQAAAGGGSFWDPPAQPSSRDHSIPLPAVECVAMRPGAAPESAPAPWVASLGRPPAPTQIRPLRAGRTGRLPARAQHTCMPFALC